MTCLFPINPPPRKVAIPFLFLSFYGKLFLLFLFVVSYLFLGGCSEKTSAPKEALPGEVSSFSSFLDDFFREYATSDTLSLHYTVQNPEALNLSKPKVSFGHLSKETLLAANRTATDYLDRLHHISRDELDLSGQLTYDLMEYALQYSLLPDYAIYYDSPLGPTTGLQTQLPILLAEYRFSSPEDINDYFLLLNELPGYFSEICAFEQERAAAGTQSCAEVLSRILLQCKSFVEDPGNNFLIESFPERLTALPDLSATETAELCITNQKLIFTKVIPAYEQLIETLSSLLDTSVPARGLAAFPEGASYYEHLVRSTTGSGKSMDEIESILEQALKENMLSMITLYQSDSLQTEWKQFQSRGLAIRTDSSVPSQNLPADHKTSLPVPEHSVSLLTGLQEQIIKDFPAPAASSFRVQTVHPSLEDFISPALYLVPPMDAYTENAIYINQAKCSFESLFSTLAHEGYPGHLYQNTFFASTSPHPARMLLNFTGYDEGWGTYAELFAYRYADCSEELQQFLVAEQVAGLCLYSLADFKIHYRGASPETIVSFLGEYGFSSEQAEEVYYTLLAEPAIYLPYSVGYLEFCSLRELYHSLAGEDASLQPFHTFLLETGPAPFPVLEKHLTENFNK